MRVHVARGLHAADYEAFAAPSQPEWLRVPPETSEGSHEMSTTVIVLIVIAAVVVLAVGAYLARQRQAQQLEERRVEADEQRSLAETKAREAEQARLAAEEQAERARARQEEAEEHRRQADEVDPDVEADADADAADEKETV